MNCQSEQKNNRNLYNETGKSLRIVTLPPQKKKDLGDFLSFEEALPDDFLDDLFSETEVQKLKFRN